MVGPLFVADLLNITGFNNPTQLEKRFSAAYERPRAYSLKGFPDSFRKMARGQRLPAPSRLQELGYKNSVLGRLVVTYLVRVLSECHEVDARWYRRAFIHVAHYRSYEDRYQRWKRSFENRGRSWDISHCVSRGSSLSLAILLKHLANAKSRPDTPPDRVRKLVIGARDVATRLCAFEPYYSVRSSFLSFLEFHFLSGWDCCQDLAEVNPHGLIDDIRSSILTLVNRGFVGNIFEKQACLAYWITQGSTEQIFEEIADLELGKSSSIENDSALYELLKHSRCWHIWAAPSLRVQYETRSAEPPRIANALDDVIFLYPDDREILGKMPTPKEIELEKSFKKYKNKQVEERSKAKKEQGESPLERALSSLLTVGLAHEGDIPPRKRGESAIAWSLRSLLAIPDPPRGKKPRPDRYMPRKRKSDKLPTNSIQPEQHPRGPPSVQQQHGVQD